MSKRVIRMLLAVLIEAVATAGLAQDLPASPACAEALDSLGKEEATLASAAASAAQRSEQLDASRLRAASARLQPLRDRAATDCLGGRPMSPPPSQHLWQPPIRVAPIVIAPPVKPATAPARAPAVPAPKPPAAPLTLTICDATGCLASDGSRLTRIGPALIGPRGLCTAQGIYVQCP